MNEFEIGRIIGELTCRVSSLEERLSALQHPACASDTEIEITPEC